MKLGTGTVSTVFGAMILSAAAAFHAHAQEPGNTPIRGTVDSMYDGGMVGIVLEMTTSEGEALSLFPETWLVFPMAPATLDDFAPGVQVAVGVGDDDETATPILWLLAERAAPRLPWSLPDGSMLVVGELTAIDEMSATVATEEGDVTVTFGDDTVIFTTGESSPSMALVLAEVPIVVDATVGRDGRIVTRKMWVEGEGIAPPL